MRRCRRSPRRCARRGSRNPAFGNFVDVNVAPHKVPGYAIVTVSLKPIGGIPGDATSEQMRVLADASERFGFGELRDFA